MSYLAHSTYSKVTTAVWSHKRRSENPKKLRASNKQSESLAEAPKGASLNALRGLQLGHTGIQDSDHQMGPSGVQKQAGHQGPVLILGGGSLGVGGNMALMIPPAATTYRVQTVFMHVANKSQKFTL